MAMQPPDVLSNIVKSIGPMAVQGRKNLLFERKGLKTGGETTDLGRMMMLQYGRRAV